MMCTTQSLSSLGCPGIFLIMELMTHRQHWRMYPVLIVEFRNKLCNNHRIRDDIKFFVRGLYQEEFDNLYDMFYYRFRDIDDGDKIKKKAVKIIEELDYKSLD